MGPEALWQLPGLLERAPAALRLVAILERARRGDRAALAELGKPEVVRDLETVWPQAGRLVRAAVAAARAWQDVATAPRVVEAEVVEVEPPWAGFVRRLRESRYGGHVILGYPGSGKTTLALKLAYVAYREHGYVVDCVELHESERPPWARKIDSQTLLHRAAKMHELSRAGAMVDPDEDRDPPAPPRTGLPAERALVIDEAGLTIPQGRHSAVREAIRELLVRCRHVNWIVIFCAQTAQLVPVDIMGLCSVWVKCPPARGAAEVEQQLLKQARTDRENPYVREVWARAAEALARLPGSAWLYGPYADLRSWAYVESPVLGYTGVVCFRPWEQEGEG